MTAALVAPSGMPGETDDLHLLLATRKGSTYDPVKKVADVAAGTETIDTTGADKLVVFVVNGLTGGMSRKPALCIGTTDEVAACRAALTSSGTSTGTAGAGGTGGSGGTGGAGGSGASGGTTSGAGGSTSGDEPGGCGCRAAGAETGHSERAIGIELSLAMVLYARRRRARATPRAARK